MGRPIAICMSREEEKEGSKGSYRGVYVSGQDFFVLSLDPTEAKGERGSSSAAFILILRRQK